MSRFYGSFSSDCTKTSTKRGHEFVEAHVRGWNFGVSSRVEPCPHCGADRVTVMRTYGSSGVKGFQPLLTLCSADCQK